MKMRQQATSVASDDTLTTIDFSRSRFVPHGLVNVRYANDILRVEARGPFNLELMQALGELRLALVDKLRASTRFGHMLLIRESALMPLDAYEVYRRDRAAVYGTAIRFPCATALVAGPDVEGWEIMAARFAEIYLADGVPYRVFATEAEARDWLRTKLDAPTTEQRRSGTH